MHTWTVFKQMLKKFCVCFDFVSLHFMNRHLVDISIEITSKNDSLRASSPSGGYREKKPRSRVLARLASLAQIEELARRLKTKATLGCTLPSKLTLVSCTCFDYPLPLVRENHLSDTWGLVCGESRLKRPRKYLVMTRPATYRTFKVGR